MGYSPIIDLKASDRGWSTELWRGIPDEGDDPRYGMCWFDDFLMGDASVSADGLLRTNKGIYTCEETASGTISVDTTLGADGILVTDPGATTAGQGYQIQGGPTVVPAAGRITTFEGRVKTTIVDPQFFFGASTITTAAVTGGATSVVSSANVLDAVAFTNIVSNDSDASLYSYNDKTGQTHVQGSTAIGTLVAATYIKLGWRINGVSSIEYWVDGVKVYTYTGSIIPALALQPIMVAQADGTQPITSLDWWRLGQTPA